MIFKISTTTVSIKASNIQLYKYSGLDKRVVGNVTTGLLFVTVTTRYQNRQFLLLIKIKRQNFIEYTDKAIKADSLLDFDRQKRCSIHIPLSNQTHIVRQENLELSNESNDLGLDAFASAAAGV